MLIFRPSSATCAAELLHTANADNWQAIIDEALGILEGSGAPVQ